MPQISPMNWLILMVFFMVCLWVAWVKIYFIK